MWSQTIPADVLKVLRTSAILSISEFRLFGLAYESWYGREGDESTIERHFLPYMFSDQVPFWVRWYTQKVLDLERKGHLEPAELGIETPHASPSLLRRGFVYSFIVLLSVIGLLLIARAAVATLGIDDCFFPPCYGVDESTQNAAPPPR